MSHSGVVPIRSGHRAASSTSNTTTTPDGSRYLQAHSSHSRYQMLRLGPSLTRKLGLGRHVVFRPLIAVHATNCIKLRSPILGSLPRLDRDPDTFSLGEVRATPLKWTMIQAHTFEGRASPVTVTLAVTIRSHSSITLDKSNIAMFAGMRLLR